MCRAVGIHDYAGDEEGCSAGTNCATTAGSLTLLIAVVIDFFRETNIKFQVVLHNL